MPNENLPHSNEPFSGQVEHEEVMKSIITTMNKVDKILDNIMQGRPRDFLDADAVYYWTISCIRERHLMVLTDFVLDMAENSDRGTAIDIDSPGLLDFEMPETSFFIESGIEASDAVEKGENLGTRDLLKILVPDGVVPDSIRGIFYHPHKRSVVETAMERQSATFFAYPSLDGSLYMPLPTRIPNLEVVFFYPPGEAVPSRTIKVKRELPYGEF